MRQDLQTALNKSLTKLQLAAQLEGSAVQIEANPAGMGTQIATTTTGDPEDQAILQAVKDEAQTAGNAAVLAAIDKGVAKLVQSARDQLAAFPAPPAP